jgi:hypothetical protein
MQVLHIELWHKQEQVPTERDIRSKDMSIKLCYSSII